MGFSGNFAVHITRLAIFHEFDGTTGRAPHASCPVAKCNSPARAAAGRLQHRSHSISDLSHGP
ncbi:Uncharacterized protein FWK35_00006307 [Aphis craccivora]|uniref:Uncharacterized protein n=1 Tax=Aphis craccivora TaxID=307492 RepID=A0A6G0ZRT7_APHCR|nr:Uncharacterized protein FWK35_00006307 [Aphis craccivora]